jgi:glycerophosphoryl diester phosphodiesterase
MLLFDLVIQALSICILQTNASIDRPLVIGHRGSGYLPELTLETQSMGHACQADMIELDINLTRDNHLIVVHGKATCLSPTMIESYRFSTNIDLYLNAISNVADIYPDRNRSDGYHHLIDFDLNELRHLTVHERVVPFLNTQVYPSRFPSTFTVPFRLATLNETIELLLGLRRSTGRPYQLLIEIKTPEYYTQINRSISSVPLATLQAYDLTRFDDPVILQTFHIEELIHIRQHLNSSLRLVALLSWNHLNESSSDYDFYRSEQGLKALSTIVQAIAPNMELVVNFGPNDSIVNATNLTSLAHKYNLAVYPWTFRRDTFEGNFEQLIEFFHRTVRVDGFITSQPDVVIELLERQTSAATRTSLLLVNFFCLIRLFS